MASFTENLNRKSTLLTIAELWNLYTDIQNFVNQIPVVFQDYSIITSKAHSLLHLVEEVLCFGANWNHSSQIYESSFNKDKKLGQNGKVNLMIAVENGTEMINSQRLFAHLSNEQLKYLGSKLTKKDLFFGKKI